MILIIAFALLALLVVLTVEHHTAITAAAVRVAACGHRAHSRPISRPHPLRQRHRGARRAFPAVPPAVPS